MTKIRMLSCTDLGDKTCDFVAEGQTDDEVMMKMMDHMKMSHQDKMTDMMKSMSEKEMTDWMKKMIKDKM